MLCTLTDRRSPFYRVIAVYGDRKRRHELVCWPAERKPFCYMAYTGCGMSLSTLSGTRNQRCWIRSDAAKTRTIVCRMKNIPNINATLENKEIVQVNGYKYLGRSRRWKLHRGNRKQKRGHAKIRSSKRRNYRRQNTRTRILKRSQYERISGVCRLYGCEPWTTNKKRNWYSGLGL